MKTKLTSQKERINKSLHKIKDLILDIMKDSNHDTAKVCNEDILDLAVKYVRRSHEGTFKDHFFRGYMNATNEVSFALSHLPQIKSSTGAKIMARLENNLHYQPTSVPLASPSSSGYGSDCESVNSDVWRPW